MTRTIRLFESDSYRRETEARVVDVMDEGVWLDRTIFYAESGGQPGDTGVLVTDGGRRIPVIDTVYTDGKRRILHRIGEAPLGLRPGDLVRAGIDWDRRHRHMRMHSALHLVCGLIDAPVTGGAIHADRGRLDFDLPENTLDKEALTRAINHLIARDLKLEICEVGLEDMDFVRERVRTADVSPPMDGGTIRMIDIPGIDLQPCGGTHVAATGEIGAVIVSKVEKKSRRNRRVTIAFVEPWAP